MEAKNIITGKKIDVERNCILKAEVRITFYISSDSPCQFAKKNLHNKKPVDPKAVFYSNNLSMQLDLEQKAFLSRPSSAGPLYAPNSIRRSLTPSLLSVTPITVPLNDKEPDSKDESLYIHSPPQIPTDILNSPEFPGIDTFPEPLSALKQNGITRSSSTNSFNEYIDRLAAATSSSSSPHDLPTPPNSNHSRAGSLNSGLMSSNFGTSNAGGQSDLFLNNLSHPTSFQHESSLDALPPSDLFPSLESSRTSTPLSLLNLMGNMSLNGANGSNYGFDPAIPFLPSTTPTPLANPNFRSTDQNPPCNTLYVGNLPPNTSPEELESLFSKCRGYRRLCFRNRPSGPMCFVEFEDIEKATMVMYELYGYPLSTHTKGGIRLSYSKNPLGVRLPQNAGYPMNMSMLGMQMEEEQLR